ncbi:RNA-binding S4 domain-containing protein [Pseudoramibacter sp.]|uniref:RNA-binding S4 domain-containing protein n=1 Tax=Pseudoramibacter sp. TaxID=2034862 RepID=UPI0025E79736|nr:RNA-binding S4 domain-containing protein [Pseudoramibacter sp.]MCH4071490.1 RNA-binding S4 domain-containing protein [Pseudoramibacter sp.]MCH4105258.1 RNA-binding S4 domain-containing protein [Pseudoramibacter sp.]
MRIDKFLKNSRLIKRRTVSKAACDSGRISVNGQVAKAGTQIKAGDIITLSMGGTVQKVKVLQTPEHVRKEDAENLYAVIEA